MTSYFLFFPVAEKSSKKLFHTLPFTPIWRKSVKMTMVLRKAVIPKMTVSLVNFRTEAFSIKVWQPKRDASLNLWDYLWHENTQRGLKESSRSSESSNSVQTRHEVRKSSLFIYGWKRGSLRQLFFPCSGLLLSRYDNHDDIWLVLTGLWYRTCIFFVVKNIHSISFKSYQVLGSSNLFFCTWKEFKVTIQFSDTLHHIDE